MLLLRATLILCLLVGTFAEFSAAQIFRNAQNFGGMLHGTEGVAINITGAPFRADIIVRSDQPRGLRYFRNFDGVFEDLSDQIFPQPIGINALEVVPGDLNGDGLDDLAIISPQSGGPAPTNVLSFAIFDAVSGHYLPEVYLPTTNPSKPFIVDVNSDGSADIVISDNPTGSSFLCVVFEQSSPLVFSGTTAAFSSGPPAQFMVGNFEGDGRPEIFWLQRQGIGLNANLLSYQNGSFQVVASTYVPAQNVLLADSRVGDFNGDGLDDIVLPGIGLAFLEHVVYGVSVTSLGTIASQLLIGSTTSTRHLTIADVQGDGRPDVVGTSFNSDLKIFVQLPNGQFIDQTSSLLPAPLPVSEGRSIVGDFNRDGRKDIVVIGVIGGGRILLGGTGGFTDTTFSRGVESVPSSVVNQPVVAGYCLGNVIGDLHPDLVELDINGKIVALEGNGSGDFRSPQVLSQNAAYLLSACAVVDVDRDGDQDLFFTDQGQDKVLLNTGGTFSVANALLPIRATDTRFVKAIDINRDGFQDLLLSGPSAPLASNRVLYGRSQGFTEALLPVAARQSFSRFDAKDLDGNGWIDLIGVDEASGGLVMVRQFGIGRFLAQGIPLPAGMSAIRVMAEDFDGDSDSDLFVLSEQGAQLLINSGSANFVPAVLPALPGGGEGVAADFNRDGLIDVAIAEPVSSSPGLGDLVVLTNTGVTGFSVSSGGLPILGLSQLVAADIDNDGDEDIISMVGSGSGTVNHSPQLFLNMHRQLSAPPRAIVGNAVTLRLNSTVPGTVVFLVASLDPLISGVSSPYGLIRVTNAANAGTVFTGPGGTSAIVLNIPNIASLVGQQLVYQAAFLDSTGIHLSSAQTVKLTL